MEQTQEKIVEAVKKAAQDGKLSCTAARKIAGEFAVAPGAVGKICDELKIKIKACELGCF